jgi:hypothetical protein
MYTEGAVFVIRYDPYSIIDLVYGFYQRLYEPLCCRFLACRQGEQRLGSLVKSLDA